MASTRSISLKKYLSSANKDSIGTNLKSKQMIKKEPIILTDENTIEISSDEENEAENDENEKNCKVCDKIFGSKKAMVTHHNQAHHHFKLGKKPGWVSFPCENCNKPFAKSKYRFRHFKKCNVIKK